MAHAGYNYARAGENVAAAGGLRSFVQLQCCEQNNSLLRVASLPNLYLTYGIWPWLW